MDTAHSGEGAGSGGIESFGIEVFGVRWAMTFHGLDREVVEHLHHLWSRALVDQGRGETDGTGSVESLVMVASMGDHPGAVVVDPVVVGTDAADIPYTISRAVTLRSITRRRGEALMLHAVGVCAEDGSTVALVAPSGTGKTTAAHTLGKVLGYVSDETIVIEDDGRISPYAKPLSIIDDPDRPFNKQEHSPDDLELLRPGSDAPPHIAAVVILRRDAQVATPEFTSEGLIDAVLEVIPETSALPALTHPLDRLCRALTGRGGPYKLRYAEIADCVDFIRSLTAPEKTRDAEAPTWEHHPGDERLDPITHATTVEWASALTRRTWTDCIVSGGEAVLLHDGVPMRLSPLGTLLWLHADAPTTVESLHDTVVERIGAHPQARNLVLEAAQMLVEAKILALSPTAP